MGLVGAMAYPHALRAGQKVIWDQRDGVATVLVVKDVKRITVEHARPFYEGRHGVRDADFTHVVVNFKGLPWPVIFGHMQSVSVFEQQFRGDD
jgi:hypothetical protein